MGTYVRYPCAHTTKKPLPTVGGFFLADDDGLTVFESRAGNDLTGF